MSFPGGLFFTNRGRALQAKAQTGVELNFTRIGVGDGQLGGQAIDELTALISEKKSLTLNKFKTLPSGKAVVGGILSNQGLVTGFYWRELGLFATDPDLGEILYCYGNAGALAEYIPAEGGAEILEKQVNVVSLIGNASNVSATIDQSLLFASQEDLLDHASLTATAHGAVSAATASTIMLRDANARSKVAAPAAADDIALKSTVTADIATHQAITTTAHGAVSAATASTIMLRDANARSKVAAPVAADDIARKDTVDAVQTNLTTHLADYIRQPGYGTTAGSANTYTLTLSPAPTYVDGLAVSVKINVTNTGAVTLNINSLGAKSVLRASGEALEAGNLVANSVYTVRYNGTNFILQGEGGGGSNIKSIQNGIVTTTTDSYVDVTISSINTSNSIVMISSFCPGNTAARTTFMVSFLSNTIIRMERTVGTTSADISWQVIEFNQVKSKQAGLLNLTVDTETTVTITSINTTNALLYATHRSSHNTVPSSAQMMKILFRIRSSTELGFRTLADGWTPVQWQLIEF